MTKPASDTTDGIRHEIAVNAARLIAEDGLDYGSAKRKAAHDLFGGRRVPADLIPANNAVENEVRVYQDLFQSDVQPARLAALRALAVELMRFLSEFSPYLTGAVLNGTAGEHSDVHVELFVDSAKDVEMHLLDRGVRFEVHAPPAGRERGPLELMSFVWRSGEPVQSSAHSSSRPETVHLTILPRDALRGALAGQRARERADLPSVERLIAQAAHPGDYE